MPSRACVMTREASSGRRWPRHWDFEQALFLQRLEHLSASKEHRMAYPSGRNNVIRNYI
jgi:hypothetical protein